MCDKRKRFNSALTFEEFVDYHNLKQIRIAITGPRRIGKSIIAN